MFATRWDAQLKLVVEAGTSPAGTLSQGALAECLAATAALHRAEQSAAAKAASGHATESHTPVDDRAVEAETRPSVLKRARAKFDLSCWHDVDIAQLAHAAMGQLRGRPPQPTGVDRGVCRLTFFLLDGGRRSDWRWPLAQHVSDGTRPPRGR